jgi:hypothetical protein
MTAEVVLMNKQAVAMAADSAGTITGPLGRKIFNSNNKLFMLSKRHPVGVMIYGSAEIMGYPWETIIKMYRKSIGKKSFPTMHEYVEDFLGHLRELELFNDLAEKIYMEMAFELIVRDIFIKISQILPEPDEDVPNLKESDKNALDWYLTKIISDIKQEVESELIESDFSESYKDKLLDKYKDFSNSLIIKYFSKYEKFGINQKIYENIGSIVKNAVFCNPEKYMGGSGLVFAGFGENEVFPAVERFSISSVIESKIMMSKRDIKSISINNTAFICPFAQSDMVDSFMFGIDSHLKETIRVQIANMLKMIPDIVSKVSNENNSSLKNILNDTLKEMYGNFLSEMDYYLMEEYMNPIRHSIANMPPNELATMAETLVSLTSFKRKISMNQQETVGGPTDVALITKGDGFIWINRKHYFNPDKNHHFFSNYHSEENNYG